MDNFIEDILNKQVKPYPYPEFPSPNSKNQKKIVVDLSFKDKETGIFYLIEIKSPKPNKDQTRQTKEKFLFLSATYPNSKVYYAYHITPMAKTNLIINGVLQKCFLILMKKYL